MLSYCLVADREYDRMNIDLDEECHFKVSGRITNFIAVMDSTEDR